MERRPSAASQENPELAGAVDDVTIRHHVIHAAPVSLSPNIFQRGGAATK
jgi:hypothetical protein